MRGRRIALPGDHDGVSRCRDMKNRGTSAEELGLWSMVSKDDACCVSREKG
jgi:hypothetical protein